MGVSTDLLEIKSKCTSNSEIQRGILIGFSFSKLTDSYFIFIDLQVFTMPEFLQKRFQSQGIRTYLTIVALFSYVFTKFSVGLHYTVLCNVNVI